MFNHVLISPGPAPKSHHCSGLWLYRELQAGGVPASDAWVDKTLSDSDFDGVDIPMDVETVVQRVAWSAGSTEHDHAFTEARLVGIQGAEDG